MKHGMSYEVVWTRRKYELMCTEGMLSDEDQKILDMHIRRKSHQEIAIALNYSDVDPINDAINRMKIIYDELAREYPDVLAPRCKSVYNKRSKKPK